MAMEYAMKAVPAEGRELCWSLTGLQSQKLNARACAYQIIGSMQSKHFLM